jgi:hypothetical protein
VLAVRNSVRASISVFEDPDRAVNGADLAQPSRMAWSEAIGRAVEKRTHAALEVEVVVDGVDGLRLRIAVEELEGAEPRLDAIGVSMDGGIGS